MRIMVSQAVDFPCNSSTRVPKVYVQWNVILVPMVSPLYSPALINSAPHITF